MNGSITEGLMSSPASISPQYFYDEKGSQLFESITTQPEYYLTRIEATIFDRHRRELAGKLPENSIFIDLGAGNCRKAEALFSLIRPSQYVAVDISSDFLKDVIERLRKTYPDLDIVQVDQDYSKGIHLPERVAMSRRVFFYPGSSLGNFTPKESLEILTNIRKSAGPKGQLILGIDLLKDRDILEGAYNDSNGITAQFNLNVLEHINRRLASNFMPEHWAHHAFLNAQESRIEMHLEALVDQTVVWTGGQRFFHQHERIHTENSYKYTLTRINQLLSKAGFEIQTYWTDEREWFAVFLAEAIS
jgi:dimethylhistidine N-methyltransferase